MKLQDNFTIPSIIKFPAPSLVNSQNFKYNIMDQSDKPKAETLPDKNKSK